MSTPYRLLGICGSIRAAAFSKAILAVVADTVGSNARFDYADIGALPHFNQDLFVEPLPPAVQQLRAQLVAANGLVISSPEYNHGMPGVLKNALDWASRPHNASPVKDKPALIITSSPAFTGGVRAQHQIRETLLAALARPVNIPEIVIGGVNAKIVDGRFTDAASVAFVRAGLDRMLEEIEMLAKR
jgi:chromate reductase, NAD(P)H dehydrogenase (quinone)